MDKDMHICIITYTFHIVGLAGNVFYTYKCFPHDPDFSTTLVITMEEKNVYFHLQIGLQLSNLSLSSFI